MDPSRPWNGRTISRLSVRALMGAVLLFALGLAYFVVWPAAGEKRASTELGGIGARVITADNRPAWVQSLLRSVPVTKLTAVDLSGTGVTDGELVHLRSFPKLGGLDLSQTAIGDAGMPEVLGASGLVQLSLRRTKVTQFRLDRLTRLEDLDLSENHFEALSLEGLDKLTSLNLRSSNIADLGLDSLKGLAALKTLDLRSTKISDADLPALAGLKNLKTLYLYFTPVTDRGVEELKRANPNLDVVRLSR